MPTQDTIDRQMLASTYGFNLAFFRSHPELNKLFKDAVKNNYDPNEFVARLRGTKWFKQTADVARKWTVLQATDPATAKQRLDQREADVRQMLGSAGVGGDSRSLARTSLLLGWDDAQLKAQMAKAYEYNPDKSYGGAAGQTIARVKQIAADYLVPISDATVEKWSRRVIAGTAQPDDYLDWAKNQAKSLMPALTRQIDAGMTVRDLVDPYAQMAEKTLGINADSIDFSASKWRKAVDVVDPKTGERSMMSLTDWERQMKTDAKYGYDTSANGRKEAVDLIGQLSKMFGGG